MFDIEKEYKKILQKTPIKGKSSALIYKIQECVNSTLSSISKMSKVVIRGGGKHTQNILSLIEDRIDNKIIAIIDDKQKGRELKGIKIYGVKEAKSLEFDTVIISSYYHREEMKKDYENVNVLDFYDELEKNGLYLQQPFYDYNKGGYEIPNFYIRNFNKNNTEQNLQYVIDSVLEIRDFINAEKYIKKYIELGYDNSNIYQNILNDLGSLFSEIKKESQKRIHRDILMFWTDAVPYNDLEFLPWIFSHKDKSVFFEKAYCNTPFTHATMRSLLKGQLPIDDFDSTTDLIDSKSSKVVGYLTENNYNFKHIGHDGKDCIDKEYDISQFEEIEYNSHVSSCLVMWSAVREMLLSLKPVFFIIHCLVETHSPFLILDTEAKLNPHRKGAYDGQYRYIDEQIEFYEKLIHNDNNIRIFMSDHGAHINFPEYFFADNKIHPYFIVCNSDLKNIKVKKIFSYSNFYLIIKWLITKDDKYFNQALSNYSLIQDVDVYNKERVLNFIDFNAQEYAFSYRGIVTIKDKYVRLRNGKEFFYNLPDERNNLIESIENFERIDELRKMAGNKFLDIYKYDKFKYSRELYKSKHKSRKGLLYWITGLSGAGKTTLGTELYYKLKETNSNVILLDGDILKHIFESDTVDYTDKARFNRAMKYARLCKMLTDQGFIVICCTIAMYEKVREWNRENNERYIEVFLDVPLDVLKGRDQKGLYSSFENGDMNYIAGLDVKIEKPKNPDLIINNDGRFSVKECIDKILNIEIQDKNIYVNDTNYWDLFYSSSEALTNPSLFAEYVNQNFLKKGNKMLELGCGNGRDSCFFAQQGVEVIGIDSSKAVIDKLRANNISKNLLFICDDFTYNSAIYQQQFDYCYSRFSLHSISLEQQDNVIKNVYNSLKTGEDRGYFFIEVRSINDDIYGLGESVGEDSFIFEGHFRRFIKKEILDRKLIEAGFKIIYSKEEKDFAPYKSSNPLIIRIVAQKI